MKKNILITVISSILLSFISQTPLHAADISIGATTWYTAWDFEWEGTDKIEYDPGLLYGPVLSLAMTPDLSMSFVFLYGKFTQVMEEYDEEIDLERYDSDLAVNYRIGNFFKLFAGAKYVAFTWSNGEHKAFGPGAGISGILPLGSDFFVLGYISGMYLFGNEEGTIEQDYDTTAREYGGNASLALAYYIPAASTTISLGGRYQQIKITYDDPIDEMVEDSVSRFYGVTLTAVYTFNI
jgi:hypothetical protein